jgi:hypothetical protein
MSADVSEKHHLHLQERNYAEQETSLQQVASEPIPFPFPSRSYITGISADGLFCLPTCCTLVSSSAVSSLKMEVIPSSETSVHIWTIGRYIPEDGNIHNYRRDNVKP